MTKKPRQRAEAESEIPDAEAEKRATEALRRALTTSYKPQRQLIGKGKKRSPNKREI